MSKLLKGGSHRGGAESSQSGEVHKVRNWLKRLMFWSHGDGSLQESVVELIEEHEQEGTVFGSEEKTMLTNIIGFSEIKVEDIVVPRADVDAVEYSTSLLDLQKLLIEKGHTRMPVFKEHLDHIVGFIHIKDILPYIGTGETFLMDKAMREILVVPPSMRITDLLVKMRVKQVHMAIVVDEHGGTDGLVTIEDLMEEIVGEIRDEHDTNEDDGTHLHASDSQALEVSARMSIAVLEEKLGRKIVSDIEEEDFETLGGLIVMLLDRIPAKGETIDHRMSGLRFTILDADLRTIKQVRVTEIGDSESNE